MNENELLSGIHSVREAVLSGRTVEKVYLEKPADGPRLYEILKECRKRKIPVSLVHPKKLELMAGPNTQGVVATLPARGYVTLDAILKKAQEANEPPLILIPEGVEDPHNLGALIRTALCSGVHGIVIPLEGSAGLTPGTARASAGAVEHMPVHRASSMPALLQRLEQAGLRLAGFEAGQGPSLWEADLKGPLAVVLGGENRGIRPHIRRELDVLVDIPIQGGIGSLNVSAAGAVALFEVRRRRNSGNRA